MGLPAVVVMKNPNERLAFSVSVRRGEQRWAGHASAIAILTKAATPTLVDCRKVSRRGKWQFFRARFYRSTKIRFSLILPLRESCWGVPSPNPAYAAYAAYPAAAMRHPTINAGQGGAFMHHYRLFTRSYRSRRKCFSTFSASAMGMLNTLPCRTPMT